MAKRKSSARQNQPDLTIWLPHWLTPEFAERMASQRKQKKIKNGFEFVPILRGDRQKRYEAIARGEDWDTPKATLKWLPPYTSTLAYDRLKEAMHIGRRVTKTKKDWRNKPGTVIAISPTHYVVKVVWDHEPGKEHKAYIYDLKEHKDRHNHVEMKVIAAPLDDDNSVGHHDDPYITTN